MNSHTQHTKLFSNRGRLFQRIFGIVLTMLFALAGYGLNELPGFHYVGPLACAMFLAILYRQLWIP